MEEEILKKVIEKAVKNGWKTNISWSLFLESQLYFLHDFAKAFWGEKKICDCCNIKYNKNLACNCCKPPHCNNCGQGNFIPSWQYNLQQLVLCKEPLKYLSKFI